MLNLVSITRILCNNLYVYIKLTEDIIMVPERRPEDMVRITTPELADAFIEEQIAALREQIGDAGLKLKNKLSS